MAKIKREEVAWMAGLFDGEGCCRIKRNGPRSIGVSMRLGMTSFDAIARCSDLMDQEGIRNRWDEQLLPSGKIIFVWSVEHEEGVRQLCDLLMPFSITKREDMETALTVLNMRRDLGSVATLEVFSSTIGNRYNRSN